MRLLLFILFLGTSFLFGQDSKIIQDRNPENMMLVGISSREAYQDSNFAWWFNSVYESYMVDSCDLIKVKDEINSKNIKIILGTWCSDSKREVPRMLKILDYLNFPEDSLTLINVDRDKNGLSDEAEGLEIEYVPTLIVYKNNEELGRIIESPQETLEKDLAEIIK